MKKKLVLVGVVAISVLIIFSLGYYMSIPYVSPLVRGEKFLRVINSAMAPTIKEGAIITCDEKFPFEQLKVDDIIVFKIPDVEMLIVSRIIYISPEGWVQTKMDNRSEPHPWKITANEYIGKVLRIGNLTF